MRLRLILFPLTVTALLAGACGAVVGPGTPVCDGDPDQIAGVVVLQAQAVPSAPYGPCINELRVGWEYSAQQTESGSATFWLDSDRMGDRFVAVTLAEECAVGEATPVESPFSEVDRFVSVEQEPGVVAVTVLAVAPRHRDFAESVATVLSTQTIEGRPVVAVVSSSTASASNEIQGATEAGRTLIIVDDREVASGTLELRIPGEEADSGISIDDAVDEIAEELDDPEYRATWYHVFDGGCITYEFDAEGAGVESVPADTDQALGLRSLDELRAAARDDGFDI